MKKRSILILLAIFAFQANILALFPNDSLSGGGDGTELNPYKIKTTFDLYSVRNAINISGGAGVATAYYELVGDVDFTGTDWTIPIGNSTNRFKGKFNGNGYKIIGLSLGSIQIPNTTSPVLGLFGSIENASITNLEVKIDFNYYKSFDNNGLFTFGGLVSTIEGGSNIINNCRVSGIINVTRAGTSNINPLRVGGIVGLISTTSSVQILNSMSDVNISATNTVTTTSNGNAYCGGIVGDAITASNVAIVNCYALGSITARSKNFNAFAGGIVGVRQGSTGFCKIYNCYSANSIDAIGYLPTTNAGGILGYSWNLATLEIRNCIALNSRIYAYNSNTTSSTPIINRILSVSPSNSIKLSDNYAIDVMDIKGWSNWTGTSGIPILTSISSNAAGVNGATLASIDPVGQTITKLNAYVATNPVFENYKLKVWTNESIEFPILIQNIVVLNSDNFAVNTMDIKSWKNWDGTNGVVTSILSVDNNLNGSTLAVLDPYGQTLINLNNYVQSYTDPANTKLLSWIIDDAGYPNFKSIISGIISNRCNEKEMHQFLKYGIENRNLLIYESAGIQELKIFNIVGIQIFAQKINGSSIIPLQRGVYILLLNGKLSSKIIIK